MIFHLHAHITYILYLGSLHICHSILCMYCMHAWCLEEFPETGVIAGVRHHMGAGNQTWALAAGTAFHVFKTVFSAALVDLELGV